jgi:SAM-dependent methyltransferase
MSHFSKHQKEWGSRLISELKLSGNEAILDLGCGDGVLTEQLATLVPNGKVTGIDASHGMLETAKHHVRNNLHFCIDTVCPSFVRHQFCKFQGYMSVFLYAAGYENRAGLFIYIQNPSPGYNIRESEKLPTESLIIAWR